MKNQILDEPFERFPSKSFQEVRNSVQQLLNNEEELLWLGHPKKKQLISKLDIVLIIVLLYMGYFYRFIPADFWGLIIPFIFIYLAYLFNKLVIGYRTNSTYYAISSNRIIWLTKNRRNENSVSMNFDNIKVIDTEEDNIVIFPKDKSLGKFQMLSLVNREKNSRPTLENIEKVNEVAIFLETQIEKYKSI